MFVARHKSAWGVPLRNPQLFLGPDLPRGVGYPNRLSGLVSVTSASIPPAGRKDYGLLIEHALTS